MRMTGKQKIYKDYANKNHFLYLQEGGGKILDTFQEFPLWFPGDVSRELLA